MSNDELLASLERRNNFTDSLESNKGKIILIVDGLYWFSFNMGWDPDYYGRVACVLLDVQREKFNHLHDSDRANATTTLEYSVLKVTVQLFDGRRVFWATVDEESVKFIDTET
jgi:hypothetical protein